MPARTRFQRLTCALILPLVLAACGSASAAPKSPPFKNPVYSHDFPDPYVLRVGSTYYAYATNSADATQNIPTLTSRDLVHWKAGKDAFPVPPRWVSSNIWAPDVYRRPDGKYVLYYAGHDISVNHECVGHAVAGSPAGPFIDRSSKPFICQTTLGGDIDPAHLRDSNGQTYLYWKNDGNCCGLDSYLYGQKVSTDGMRLLGKAVKLTKETQSWEGSHVEAPFMWKHGSSYYLFFSANEYASYDYAVGYARCTGSLGPCQQASGNPILKSSCKAAGPGGETIVTDSSGQTWMLYHAWSSSAMGDQTVGRRLWLDRLDWKGGNPVVHGPTCTAQPSPAT